MASTEKLVKRSDKVAFMKIDSKYVRMTKFTDISNSKNPSEYSRQYVDEEVETTDIVGFSPEKSFAFDQHINNPVHEKLVDIIENELTGDDAVVEILVVDKSKTNTDGSYEAKTRNYAVVADSDGDSTDAYTYSGSFKAKGAFTSGSATLNTDETEATFTSDTSEE